jgi:hypothetical protein
MSTIAERPPSDPFRNVFLNFHQPPKNGSLICIDNLAPRWQERILYRFAKSSLSHVGCVLYVDGEPFYFEAYPPVVRRISWQGFVEVVLAEWCYQSCSIKQGGLLAFALEPPVELEKVKAEKMLDIATEHLEEPYGLLMNYFRGTSDWHCSEYCDAIYSGAGMISNDGHRCTPTMMHDKLIQVGFTESTERS